MKLKRDTKFGEKQYIYSAQKDHIKMKIFETFKCSNQNSFKFLMSILKWQANSSLNFASFFTVMTHNSSVDFKLISLLFWIKGSNQSPNFETCKCSGENWPYSSCHFPNHSHSSNFASPFSSMKDNSSVLL